MSINVKPINEVPEIEALSEGDKLLVNSSGAAKQIDASKVGGSGGGGSIIYCGLVGMDGETLVLSCHKDAGRTEAGRYSFSEFSALTTSGVIALSISEDGVVEMYATPMVIMPYSATCTAQTYIMAGSQLGSATLVFSDTNLE